MSGSLNADSTGLLGEGEIPNEIGGILSTLEQNKDVRMLSDADLCQIFSQLRDFIVQNGASGLLSTQHALDLLCDHGFEKAPSPASRIALRCVCNLLLLSEPARQLFVNGKRVAQAINVMKSEHSEDQLVASRLLLLCTYGTDLNVDDLVRSSDIVSLIHLNLSRQFEPSSSDLDLAACQETLKLLSNLMALSPNNNSSFNVCLAPIFDLLRSVAIPSPPLQPPISSLINCLVFYRFEHATESTSCHGCVFPLQDSNTNVDRLSLILKLAAQFYNDEELDKHGAPLVQTLLRIAEISPEGPKARLKSHILPSSEDRRTVLGVGNSLSAILLRAATSIASRDLRLLLPSLFFELSDKDPGRLVHNVGYGYASGFLSLLGVPLPPGPIQESATAESRLDINPVSGQRRELETKTDMPEMTNEEKEREAERLFVLFERLRGTGIINVPNPVSVAAQEGRLKEIDEDD
ncbi:hypothetical protein N7523_005536 [Penicillium sp. IBT 18751x]|nr:hypothetical protein N7523_005878 [Penicillium sp. IBT 18751x]KAJ6117785.1 hypothetical protein N7523_005536 [Penicillium sp. IBT 18751x]